MNKETHIYLAEKIHESVLPAFSVDLSLDVFKESNIKPDQTSQSILHPHFASWSFDYVRNLIIQLSREHLVEGEKVPSDFIVSLGLITHYLCDFFCQVHFGRQLFRIREHIEYETRLQYNIFKKRHHFDKICQMKPDQNTNPVINVKQIYTQCLTTYNQMPAGFERDMLAATWISVQVANGVIHHCLQNDILSTVSLRCAHSY